MIRRLTVERSTSPSPGTDAPAPVVRLLAVSDEEERAFEVERNRENLGRIDGLIGAGDLSPSYLAFLADAFRVPLLHVRGNHDRGGGWTEGQEHLPVPVDGSWHDLSGLIVAGLSWPSDDRRERAVHDDGAAWRQVAACYLRFHRHRPDIIVSHVPPLGVGDTPGDHYHRGFAAYRWLMRRLKPALWIHGHTSLATVDEWAVTGGPTTVINVTGAVLVEMVPPDATRTADNSAASPSAARVSRAGRGRSEGL